MANVLSKYLRQVNINLTVHLERPNIVLIWILIEFIEYLTYGIWWICNDQRTLKVFASGEHLTCVASQTVIQCSNTVYPRSSDPFYILTYYIKWLPTSWTDDIILEIFRIFTWNGRSMWFVRLFLPVCNTNIPILRYLHHCANNTDKIHDIVHCANIKDKI